MQEKFMKLALNEAKKAYKNGDVPVGVVITKGNQVLSKAYNKKAKLNNPIKHAEIIAIEKACHKINDFRLEDCDIYITLEPCLMCYGAILSARLKNVYFGAYDKKFSIKDVGEHVKFNHTCNMVGGVLENECSALLSSFFAELRSEKCKLKH